jgi:hypothetical protein
VVTQSRLTRTRRASFLIHKRPKTDESIVTGSRCLERKIHRHWANHHPENLTMLFPLHRTKSSRNMQSARFTPWKPRLQVLEDRTLLATSVFNVDVSAPWRDTGIALVAGQTLQMTTDPNQTVVFGAGGSTGTRLINANGVGDFGIPPGLDGTQPASSDSVIPGTIRLALIGKTGGTNAVGDGTPIPEGVAGKGPGFVGTSYNQVIPTSGELFLGLNDETCCFFDNSGSFTVTITVNAPGPVSVTGSPVTATEGNAFSSVVASFSDTDTSPAGAYSASIAWGDGTTSAGTITPNGNGGFNVSGTQTYAEEGTYAVNVTITDSGGTTAQVNSTANVADASLLATGTTFSTTINSSASNALATFTDADPAATAADYTATITWGDGTTASAGSIAANGIGGFIVSAAHPYGQAGSTVQIGDAALTATGINISPKEGANFSGAVAKFTDADPKGTVADYTATITWGDSNFSAGTIKANSNGGFTVSGRHAYGEGGSFAISVAIKDAGSSQATTSTATVVDYVLTHATGKSITALVNKAFHGVVATFTDTDPTVEGAGKFTATITWGDGTSASGTLKSLGGGKYTRQWHAHLHEHGNFCADDSNPG